MVKHSHPAEHPVTTEAVAHASGLLIAVNSVQVDQKATTKATLTQQAVAQDSRCGQAFLPSRAPGYNRSSCTRQWLLIAVNSVQVDQKAATKATLTQQAAAQDSRCGPAFSPSRAPGYNRSSCTRQWLLIAVNSVQVDQKAATRATLTQQAAAQDSRCGQAFSPSRAPGYNISSCTRQWLLIAVNSVQEPQPRQR